MASSQKYMTYIMPFFALTGLYWPFGLVLYWVTTNVWTLGQQWILGRRYPYTPPAAEPDSDTPAPAAARSLTSGRAKAGAARSTAAARGTGTRPARQGRAAQQGRATQTTGKTGSRPAANGASANGAAGAGGGVLKRLGRARVEPEPQPDLPEVKLVRHQTQRQSRSKRSGKR